MGTTIINTEIWKDINGYEGLYQVSNIGRVKNLERMVCNNTSIGQLIPERILKMQKNLFGYYMVTLCVEGSPKRKQTHRLVAETFIPNPLNKRCVNHINGDKSDNRVENLEWCTHSENARHAYDILKRRKPIKGKRDSYETGVVQIDAVTGGYIAFFKSIRQAARETGTDRSSICDVVKGRLKTANGFKWEQKK